MTDADERLTEAERDALREAIRNRPPGSERLCGTMILRMLGMGDEPEPCSNIETLANPE